MLSHEILEIKLTGWCWAGGNVICLQLLDLQSRLSILADRIVHARNLTWSRVIVRIVFGKRSSTAPCIAPITQGTGTIGRVRPVCLSTRCMMSLNVNTMVTFMKLRTNRTRWVYTIRAASLDYTSSYFATDSRVLPGDNLDESGNVVHEHRLKLC